MRRSPPACREQAARHQARRDIGRHEQVVEFERAAQRDQDHQPPQAVRVNGKPVQPRRHFACITACVSCAHTGIHRRPPLPRARIKRPSIAGRLERLRASAASGRPAIRALFYQYTARPPEMSKTPPVVNEHSSDDSQAIIAAISSGSTNRPIGIFDNM